MSDSTNQATNPDKSPMDTAAELKVMLTDYARQETVGPLQRLGKWVGFGVAGAVCIAVGLTYLSFALLRGLQTIDAFQGNGGSFAPYLIVFGALAVCIAIAAWAMSRKFSDQDTQDPG